MFSHQKFKDYFSNLRQMLFSPKIDSQETQEQLQKLKSSLPIPTFWLFGKTQSGKTSIIKALTNQNGVEIGNGFEACTQFSQKYAFPSPQDAFIHFLDTKGVGEVEYDPSDDIALFEQSTHILMVVVKALDTNLDGVLHNLKKITQNKNYPILVVQTTIHEGYEDIGMEHIEPYPFDTLPFANVPQNLSRSILHQRELFKQHRINVQKFVVVDVTKEEDGYANIHYGLSSLWDAIEEVFPYSIRQLMIDNFSDIYASKAHPHIITHALLAGASEMIPLPMASIPIATSIQAKMLHSIASIYNQKLSTKIITELTTALGTSFVLSLLGRQLVKFIPIYGSVFNAIYTGAITYALGRLLCIYFNRTKEGEMLTQSEIRTLFKEEFKRGKEFIKPYMESMR
ncbi:MAG: 50S ribosome-binding GTPase [Campylobacterales bacterium]|nr:50S ribosome-binding GTPase [Campylobacterales bacterium]